MNTAIKKSCWNCETGVLVSQENCISCGVYLSPFSPSETGQIFIPPYRTSKEEEENEDFIPHDSNKIKENEEENSKTIIFSITLLILGSLFLLLSLLMLVFAENGRLTLSWNANYWYLYFFFSPIFLFFGWKKL